MADTALRELLARFTVQVDPEGNLPKGNRLIDALRDKLKGVDAQTRGLNQRLRGAFTGLPSGIRQAAAGIPAALSQVGNAATAVGMRMRDAFNGARQSLNEPRLGFISRLATLKNAFLALGIQQATKWMWGFVDSTLAAADAVGKGAISLGVTTDQFQELQTVAALGGAQIQDIGTAFTALTRNAEAFARTGEGEATPAFQALGLQVRGSNGQLKPAIELFYEAGEALNGLDNETQKQAFSQKLLGESGRKLFPVFASLSKMTAEQRAELRATAIVYGEDFIAASENANDQMLLAGKVVEGLKARFIGALLPVIVGAAEGLQNLGKWLKETTKGLSLGRFAFVAGAIAISPYVQQLRALVALGGGWTKTLGNMGRGLTGFLKTAAPLLAVFLAIEDVFTFFSGGDSLLGRGLTLLDKALGGTGQSVKELQAAFQDLWKWIFGDGQGEKAKALYRDIIQGIELLVHDLLVSVGVRRGERGLQGLEAFNAQRAQPATATRVAENQLERGAIGLLGAPFGPVGALLAGSLAGPATIPVQAGGERQGTTIIDNSTKSVQVSMSPGSSPAQVADAVSKRLEADRNAIVDRVP